MPTTWAGGICHEKAPTGKDFQCPELVHTDVTIYTGHNSFWFVREFVCADFSFVGGCLSCTCFLGLACMRKRKRKWERER